MTVMYLSKEHFKILIIIDYISLNKFSYKEVQKITLTYMIIQILCQEQ